VKRFMFLVLLPVICYGGAHTVPLGTHGNELQFIVQNKFKSPLTDVTVVVLSNPDFLFFKAKPVRQPKQSWVCLMKRESKSVHED